MVGYLCPQKLTWKHLQAVSLEIWLLLALGRHLQADFGGRFPRNWACLGQWSMGPGLSPESPRIPSNSLESISPAFRLESSAAVGKPQRPLEASKSSSDHENCRNRCIPKRQLSSKGNLTYFQWNLAFPSLASILCKWCLWPPARGWVAQIA